MTILAIAIAGAAGALSRYALNLAFARGDAAGFPWATLTVNVLGCLAIGALTGWFATRADLSPAWRAGLVTGFLGSFTTFSAFGLETIDLLRRSQTSSAIVYVTLSVGLGLAAVWMGWQATSR